MFENLMRELRNMERMQMSFPIESDEDGYIDKECPNRDCLFQFKVHKEDWKNIFKDEAVYCPKCGKSATSNQWFTTEQVNAGKEMAINNVKAMIGNAMREEAKQFNRNNKKGFLTFAMKVNGFNEQIIKLPIKCKEIFEQKIKCEKCNARYEKDQMRLEAKKRLKRYESKIVGKELERYYQYILKKRGKFNG